VNRRSVVLALLAGVVAGAGGLFVLDRVFGPDEVLSLDAVPVAVFDDLGAVTEIVVDERFFVPFGVSGDPASNGGTVDGAALILVREDGGVSAFLARSPFLGCRLVVALGEEAQQMFGAEIPGDPLAWVLVDPCHGGVYSLEGRRLAGPASPNMVAFPTGFTSDGRVTVDLTRPTLVADA